MAYNEILEERISDYLIGKSIHFEKKKMMGGLCFMIDDKMCLGLVKEQLMARVSPVDYPTLLKRSGANEMKFTGRSMKGYLFVEEKVLVDDSQLYEWIDLCLAFNPFAKSSKSRKK